MVQMDEAGMLDPFGIDSQSVTFFPPPSLAA